MKLIHLSDLHIGKKIYGYSMLEDQKHILNKILNIIIYTSKNITVNDNMSYFRYTEIAGTYICKAVE